MPRPRPPFWAWASDVPRTPLSVVGGTRRRYTKRTKINAVIAAELTSTRAAAEAAGIPERTVGYWMDDPAFAQYRTKTREELGPEGIALAHNVLGEIKRRLPEFEPRDLTILYGVLVDKGQLLSGQATSRSEHRDVTAELDDHERETLTNIIREATEAVHAGG